MNAHPGLEKGLDWLLNHSLQAGVLVLLVLAVQWIFRRQLANRWRFALWWIVLARLLLPFNPESALSLFNVFRPVVQLEPTPPAVLTQVEPVPQTEFTPPDFPLTENTPPPPPANPVATPPPSHPPRLHDLLIPGLAALWFAGVVALCGMVAIQLNRFRRKLTDAAVPSSPELQKLLDDCRREFAVSRQITLLETGAVQSPALFGLRRPRLLLPRGIGEQFAGRELRYIFLHELAHVKRGDLWLNWLVTALQILHWFNPLLWLGFARMRADRELACDELALLRAGDNAGAAYGETVIKLLENLNRPAAIPGLVGILEDKKQMRRRIAMIVNFQRPGRWSALAVVLIAAVAAAALTDAQTNRSANAPAHLKVENDPSNLTDMVSSTNGVSGYDETYTSQNQAPHVHVDLPGARTNGLNLNTEWGKKYGSSSAPIGSSDLAGIVHDPANHPIANATISIFSAWSKRDQVESRSTADCQKHTTSDASGRFTFSEVDSNMLFRVLATADGYQPGFYYPPESWTGMASQPVEILLHPKAVGTQPGEQVLGRVVASDGMPIPGALIQGYMLHTAEAWTSSFGGVDGMAITDSSGNFALRSQSNFIACSFYVEALGRQVKGVVLLPDGRLAADAQVALQVNGYPLQLDRAKFISLAPPDNRLGNTGPDGSFTLPLYENAESVVALNGEGIAQVSLTQLESSPQITLQKWGRIEGTLRLGHHVGSDEMVGLWPKGQGSFDSRPPLRYEPPLQPLWYTLDAYQTRTDREGRFVFMFVPPGWQNLSRETPIDEQGWRSSPLNQIEVKPGETTAINAGVSCRTVIGRLKFTGTTPKSLTNSIGFMIGTTHHWQFPVFDIAADGTFRAEYVLPGTYHFRFVEHRHRLPDENGFLSVEGIVGYSPHEFTVPEPKNQDDDSIVECGTVELE